MTNPINPESDSQIQTCRGASNGSNVPLVKSVNSDRNANAMSSRIKFTGIDPTLWLADSNARAVAVQQIAVKSAANSPIWEVIIIF